MVCFSILIGRFVNRLILGLFGEISYKTDLFYVNYVGVRQNHQIRVDTKLS